MRLEPRSLKKRRRKGRFGRKGTLRESVEVVKTKGKARRETPREDRSQDKGVGGRAGSAGA